VNIPGARGLARTHGGERNLNNEAGRGHLEHAVGGNLFVISDEVSLPDKLRNVQYSIVDVASPFYAVDVTRNRPLHRQEARTVAFHSAFEIKQHSQS
jgi:hypothetical protein